MTSCDARAQLGGYEFRTGQRTGIHPDAVAEAMRALKHYGGDAGPFGADAVARALIAARAWQDRREAEEREHYRREAIHAAESRTLAAIIEARRRARIYCCEVCSDKRMRQEVDR